MKIPSWRSWVVFVGLSLLAVLTALAMAEVGLRAAGWWMDRSRQPVSVKGSKTILCLGDSWTWGAESGDVARLSYPAQLQALLDRRYPRGRYRVVNRGKPGMSGESLAEQLPNILKRHKPHVVVLLVGGVVWVVPGSGGVELSRRSSAMEGPLSHLRVVRLLRTLHTRPGFTRSPELRRRARQLRQQLIPVFQTNEAAQEKRGVPHIPYMGCRQTDSIHLRLEQLRKTGDPVGAGISALMEQEPTCMAVWITGAELCLRRRDFNCAEDFVGRVLQYHQYEPHALVVQALVRRHKAGKWTRDIWRGLNAVRERHPAFLRARRFALLAHASSNLNICHTHADLQNVLVHDPGCTWARRALKITGKTFGPSMHQQFGRRYRQYMTIIARAVKRNGASLLLLNYPPSEINPCQTAITGSIARYSEANAIPRLELGPVLGPITKVRVRKLFSTGGHPNAAGYREMAMAVSAQLRELGWVGVAQ